MKRTAEKVLSIISVVFTAMSLIGSFIFLAFIKTVTSDGVMRREMELDLYSDPEFSAEEVEMIMWFVDFLEGFGWFLVVVLIISLIASVVGIIFMWNDKNPKLAGIMFIIAGLFAFVLSLTSILLYVAGVFCLTKKAPLVDEPPFVEESLDGTMRPL